MPARPDYSATLAKLKELADDLPKAMRTTVETMLSEQIGARHQERSSDRSSHRNGYRQRALGPVNILRYQLGSCHGLDYVVPVPVEFIPLQSDALHLLL